MSSSRETVKLEKLERRHLYPMEVERIIDAAGRGPNGVRDRAMAWLLYDHALRVSELCNLTIGQVHFELGMLNTKRLKEGKEIIHPMKAHTVTALTKWKKIRPEVGYRTMFISRQGAPFTRQGINYLMSCWGRRAGLDFRVYPHMLRHSCGYALINHRTGTRSLRQIQDWLGHKDIKNTERYTALAEDRFDGLWGDDA